MLFFCFFSLFLQQTGRTPLRTPWPLSLSLQSLTNTHFTNQISLNRKVREISLVRLLNTVQLLHTRINGLRWGLHDRLHTIYAQFKKLPHLCDHLKSIQCFTLEKGKYYSIFCQNLLMWNCFKCYMLVVKRKYISVHGRRDLQSVVIRGHHITYCFIYAVVTNTTSTVQGGESAGFPFS